MAWKIKPINLAWNQITGRKRKPLVMPRDFKIPTAEVTLTVELIEEYKVLKKFVLHDQYCWLVVDDVEGLKIIAFDDDGNPYNATLPDSIRYSKVHKYGYPDVYVYEGGPKK